MGLAAFLFFVVPWMALAVWLFRLPSALRLGVPPTAWRPLTDFPQAARDQRREEHPHNTAAADGSGPSGGDKHEPLVVG